MFLKAKKGQCPFLFCYLFCVVGVPVVISAYPKYFPSSCITSSVLFMYLLSVFLTGLVSSAWASAVVTTITACSFALSPRSFWIILTATFRQVLIACKQASFLLKPGGVRCVRLLFPNPSEKVMLPIAYQVLPSLVYLFWLLAFITTVTSAFFSIALPL